MKKNTTLSEQFHNKNNLHDAEDASTIIQILDSIQGPGADPGFHGVFRVKNHYFTPKNHIFSNCGGSA